MPGVNKLNSGQDQSEINNDISIDVFAKSDSQVISNKVKGKHLKIL